MHVYTNKNYVLRTINSKLSEKGDFKYLDILVFDNKDSKQAESIESLEQLEEVLKDYDKVYSFYEAESLKHGVTCYDIILKG